VRWFFCLFCFFILSINSLRRGCAHGLTITTWCSITASRPITTITAVEGRFFPSTIELLSGALPVEKKNFFTPPNALRLHWRSVAAGVGDGAARGQHAQPADGVSRRHPLHLVLFAGGHSCRRFAIHSIGDQQHDFTVPVKLGGIEGDFPAKRWFQVRLPLSEFETASIHPSRHENCTACTLVRALRTTRLIR